MMSDAQVATMPALAADGHVRKKFAVPPAKLACLACRSSRTRCDGGQPCASCQNKCRDCVYKPSRRGGARVRRKERVPDQERLQRLQQAAEEMQRQKQEQQPLTLEHYIDPGAGLAQIQEADWYQDSDVIFDSLFMSDTTSASATPSQVGGPGSIGDADFAFSGTGSPAPYVPMVRRYADDAALLDAYYVFIHMYFPILPAPVEVATDRPTPRFQNQMSEDLGEEELTSLSPLALAISAILALVPCAEDTRHAEQEAVVFRRRYAQFLAQAAVEGIEAESELPESSVEPQLALEETTGGAPTGRMPFHPGVPAEIESVIALDVLSVYEYAQRGNLRKMQSRAGQALVAAMALGLHTTPDHADAVDARRRAWWMTYICVCQGSIVSSSKPTFEVFAPSFTTPFPLVAADLEAFAVYVQSQQAILAATQFVSELNRTVQAGVSSDMAAIFERMREFEAFLEPLNRAAEMWQLPGDLASPVEASEVQLARSLRCMARIKLNSARIKIHRYCAFFDHPVFTRKLCDLKSVPADPNNPDSALSEPRAWPACSCSSSFAPAPGMMSGKLSSSSVSPPSDGGGLSADGSNGYAGHAGPFPFSSHHSAKICLKSALNIAQSFDNMPFPNPTGSILSTPRPMTSGSATTTSPLPSFGGLSPTADRGQMPSPAAFCVLSPGSTTMCPRTMPSFACCAMQCAYALLMVYNKTKALRPADELGGGMGGMGGGGSGVGVGDGGSALLATSLMMRLQHGLASILATLENYGTAFEALGGMRDQIRSAVDPFLTLG